MFKNTIKLIFINKDGSTYMIFAWNDQDPSTNGNDWKFHDKNRFSKSLLLLSFQNDDVSEDKPLPSDTFTHEFRMRDVTFLKNCSEFE